MRGIVAGLVCLVSLAGCATTYQVELDGFKLHQRSRALRMTGKSVVDANLVVNGDSSLSETKPYAEPVAIDQAVIDKRGRERWIRDLLRGCADDDYSPAANIDCELDKPMSYYRTREWEKRSTTRFVQWTVGTAITGLLGGAIACNAFCDEDTRIYDVSHVAVYAMGGALAAILVWGIIDCAGKWGQPGCRD